jgi:type II secretory pathway pseudopilin PulG
MKLLPIHDQRRNRQGMVLLEVIMALTIFILVGFSLVVALQSAFDAALERNQVDMAVRGLQNQMELLHTAPVTTGATTAPDDGTGITYQITVTQVQMQDQKNQVVPNIYNATITATWLARGEQEERDVSELIYQP